MMNESSDEAISEPAVAPPDVDRMRAGNINVAVPNLDPSQAINRKHADELTSMVQLYALCYGFHVSQNSARGGGLLTLYCVECAAVSKIHDKLTATPQIRDGGEVVQGDDRSVDLCPQWLVKINQIQKDKPGESYNMTMRKLIHCHVLDQPRLIDGGTRAVDSFQRITATERSMLEKLITSRRINKSMALKETMQDIYTCKYDDNVWKYLLSETRARTEIPDGKEMSVLLSMLHERHLVYGDYFNFTIDSECVTDRVFIMSKEQIWNCQRNGVVVAMDTTMKLNRFGLPMCFVCGIDEYGHTMLLAIALTLHQDTDSFKWILENVRRAVGDVAWFAIRSITTDGDKAMTSAIAAVMSHAHHMRCVFHLRMNIKARLAREKLDAERALQISFDWYLIASRNYTLTEYQNAKAKFQSSLPPVIASYFNANIWSIEKQYVSCLTKHVTTVGIRSTSRVEGTNSKVKGCLGVNVRTPLPLTVSRLLQSVTDEQKKKIDDDRQSDKAKQATRHALAAWWWDIHVLCSPVAVDHFKQEAELDENYSVTTTSIHDEFLVRPSSQTINRYDAELKNLSAADLADLAQLASNAQLNPRADVDDGLIEQSDIHRSEFLEQSIESTSPSIAQSVPSSSVEQSIESTSPPIVQSVPSSSVTGTSRKVKFSRHQAMLYALVHEEVCIVRNLRSGSVTCSCGGIERLLLPCRHVIAANRFAHGKRFLQVQLHDRWLRSYMLDGNNRPTAPKIHTWQSSDFCEQPDIESISLTLPVDNEFNLEAKVDDFLSRTRAVALTSVAVFGQLTALVKPWMQRVFVSNPRLAITQARDPSVVYGANASDTRILSNGEEATRATKARPASAADLENLQNQNKRARSQGINIHPVPALDDHKTQ